MTDTSQLNFHSVPTSAILSTLDSTTAGLSSDEACARLQKFGSNRLPEPPVRTVEVTRAQVSNHTRMRPQVAIGRTGVIDRQYNSDSMPRSRLTVALTRRRFALYYGEISAKLEEVGLFFLYHPSGAITLKVRQL